MGGNITTQYTARVSTHPAFGSDTANLVWLVIISLSWMSLYVYIFPTADKTAQRKKILMAKLIDFLSNIFLQKDGWQIFPN